jgi:hypothetical protein
MAASQYQDGKPDARFDPAAPVTRFRPRYRALSEAEQAQHDAIKAAATMLEGLYDNIPPGRYQSLAMTALEQSVMWAVKSLTA